MTAVDEIIHFLSEQAPCFHMHYIQTDAW